MSLSELTFADDLKAGGAAEVPPQVGVILATAPRCLAAVPALPATGERGTSVGLFFAGVFAVPRSPPWPGPAYRLGSQRLDEFASGISGDCDRWRGDVVIRGYRTQNP